MPACASSVSPLRRRAKLANSARQTIWWQLAIIVGVAGLDQITKFWALDALSDQPTISVLGSFLQFTLVYNLGGAMGTNLGTPLYYLVIASLVLPFILYYMYSHRRHRAISLPLAFIAGGAIGNFIDRVRLGKVVDFIDVDFFDINLFGYQLDRFWTFNIADSAITCSIVFLLAYLVFSKHDQKKLPVDTDIPVSPADPADRSGGMTADDDADTQN